VFTYIPGQPVPVQPVTSWDGLDRTRPTSGSRTTGPIFDNPEYFHVCQGPPLLLLRSPRPSSYRSAPGASTSRPSAHSRVRFANLLPNGDFPSLFWPPRDERSSAIVRSIFRAELRRPRGGALPSTLVLRTCSDLAGLLTARSGSVTRRASSTPRGRAGRSGCVQGSELRAVPRCDPVDPAQLYEPPKRGATRWQQFPLPHRPRYPADIGLTFGRSAIGGALIASSENPLS